MNTRDPIYDLAVLCRNMFRKSFKDLSYMIHEDALRENLQIRRAVLVVQGILPELIILFYEDHAVVQIPGWGPDREREVSYSDPKLMDILLSELRKQFRNR